MEQLPAADELLPLSGVAEAALALHRPGLGIEGVGALLERLVTRLGLATAPMFVTNAMTDVERADAADHAAPVRRPDGVLEGVLRCRPVDECARGQVDALAAHAGVAMAALAERAEIARREQAARRVAEQLQDALLPRLPDLPATLLDVRYRAASRDARVGGDFYDVFAIPDGRVLVVVGDVMGKGVEAAGRTSRITQTLRALALQGLPLEELLERCDEQVTYQDPETMATVWCGLYEPDTGELAFASLGHPPALLLRESGEPTGQDAIALTLEGLPLGMRDLADDPPEVRRRLLTSRDLLVLYTDGVVEASGDLLAGMDALQRAIERRRGLPLTQLIGETLDELLADAGHRDDALLLLLRRR